MRNVEFKALTGCSVSHRLLLTGSLVLWGAVAAGCATTDTAKSQATAAAGKSNGAYTVRRASIRTPATNRLQRNQTAQHQKSRHIAQAAQRNVTTHTQQVRNAPRPLTKAQYHARYQAQKRAAEQAAKEHRLAAARAALARKQAEEKAIRDSHIAKWKLQQQKRAQYNKEWQQEQLARKKQAALLARKAELQKKQLAAQQKLALAQNKVSAKPAPVVKKPAMHKQVDPRAKYLARWNRLQAEKKLEAKKAEMRVERVIYNAKKQIGRKYVWGGASPRRGFDCSGLVQHSMRKGASVNVPRTAAQQYKASVKVPAHQAERGDLVFFITRGKSVSHVGIYLGNNKFVHAPRTGRTVTTSNLSGYWKKRFVGFGRIPGACRLPV